MSTQVTFLRVEIADFKRATFGAEWLFPLGNLVEIGLSVGLFNRTVHTPYQGYK